MDPFQIVVVGSLLSIWIGWMWWQWAGGFMETQDGLRIMENTQPKVEAICISKRCKKCGVQPNPSDMMRLWGYKWEEQTMCTSCRNDVAVKEAWVVMVPKIKNIPPEQIKEWYIPLALREFARESWRTSPSQTKVYISDGDRFWLWMGWPQNKMYFTKFDDFIKAMPDWKIITPYGVKIPEASSYVAN